MKDITEKFKQKFPLFKDHIKVILPTPPEYYMYKANISLVEAYRIALQNDPSIDHYDIPYVISIPMWIEYHMIVDFLSDQERKAFKAEHLTGEEHAELALYLNKNKLKRTLLENIDRLFEDKDIGYPSLIKNNQLRSKWKTVRRVFTSNKPGHASTYENYDVEARIHYIDMVTQLIRTICIEYIKVQAPLL